MPANLFARLRALQRNARLYLLSNMLQAVTAGAIGVLYTLYLSALGYGTDFIGLVAVIGTIGAGLGILPANRLVAKLGWRATLIWSNLVGGVAIAAQLVAPLPAVIVVTTVGIGASVALVLVVNTPLLTAYSAPEQRTALFGLNNALVFLATVVGSLLGGVLPEWFIRADMQGSAVLRALDPLLVPGAQARAYELALVVMGAIALPSIVPILLMHEERAAIITAEGAEITAGEKETHRPDTPSEVGGSAWEGTHVAQPQRSGKRNRGRKAAANAWRVTWREQTVRQALAMWVAARGVIGRFAVTQGLVGFGAGIFFPYVNLYFVNRLGASPAYFGALSAALAVVVAGASLVAAPLARHLGTIRSAIAAQVASLPCLLAIGAFPLLGIASLTYLLRGGLMGLTGPPLQTYLMEAVPERQRVPASSAYNVSFQVSWALGAGFGGWLITLAGYRAPFLAAAPFYALSAVLLAIWFGRRR